MLKINTISLSIGKKNIFKDFSAKFYPSDIVFVKGKNGSGKTSFLKIIANLLYPSNGSITIGIHNTPISQALQPYCLYLSVKEPIRLEFTVLENIKFWLSIYNKPDLLKNIIEIFKIKKILIEKCTKLSAGNLRKISLIRIYISDVLVYLLDEVETTLDLENTKVLTYLIKEKSNKKAIIFLATNSQPFMQHNKLIKIQNNKIILSNINPENSHLS